MIIQILLLIAGLVLILLGANYLVDGSSSIAKRFGISEFLIGLTIVGIGTSTPEMVVSFLSAFQGKADMAIGNVVGSNVFNFTILAFADVLYTKGGIYMHESQTINLIVFGMLSTLFTMGVIKGQKNKVLVLVCSLLILASYVASIALSM